MTFKEVFKKIENANEINKLAGMQETIKLELNYDNYRFDRFNSYKELISFIREEYIPEVAKPLEKVEFEIGKDFVISYYDNYFQKEYKVAFKIELVFYN